MPVGMAELALYLPLSPQLMASGVDAGGERLLLPEQAGHKEFGHFPMSI